MLHHVVLFALDGFDSQDSKRAHLHTLRTALEALPELITPLVRLEVHLNDNPHESYDLMLTAEVTDLAALAEYAAHPEHVRVVNQLIKPYLKQRACIDYVK